MHIVQRGNNRGMCFFGPSDYLVYLQLLAGLSSRLGCAVHAYCLMTNHVHLLITPPTRTSCAMLMKSLSQRYVQYVNRARARSGTLWEGRFRSCLAQSARYVLACHRYIELNPVRARMVARPDEYAWSSYRMNARGQSNPLLTPHPEYLALGIADSTRQAAYRALFDHDLETSLLDGIRSATNGGHALGSERFRLELESASGRPTTPGRPGRPRKNRVCPGF